MMRTTLYLPESLHQRLQIAFKQKKKKSMSGYAVELLDKALSRDEDMRLDYIYKAMEKTKGICKDPITDASTTIDEVLYGEKGEQWGNEK